MELLVKDLEPIASKLTFISDRQKGLLEAFSKVIPTNDTRYCARHIWTNFKATHPGLVFKELFWKASRAFTKPDFDQVMESIKHLSDGSHGYLSSIPTARWSRHAFTANCTSGESSSNSRSSSSFSTYPNKF